MPPFQTWTIKAAQCVAIVITAGTGGPASPTWDFPRGYGENMFSLRSGLLAPRMDVITADVLPCPQVGKAYMRETPAQKNGETKTPTQKGAV